MPGVHQAATAQAALVSADCICLHCSDRVGQPLAPAMLTHMACREATDCRQVWAICHGTVMHQQQRLGAHTSLQHSVADTCLHASDSVKLEDSSKALRIPAAWLALQHVQAWNSWQTGSRPALLGGLVGWDRGNPTCTQIIQSCRSGPGSPEATARTLQNLGSKPEAGKWPPVGLPLQVCPLAGSRTEAPQGSFAQSNSCYSLPLASISTSQAAWHPCTAILAIVSLLLLACCVLPGTHKFIKQLRSRPQQ